MKSLSMAAGFLFGVAATKTSVTEPAWGFLFLAGIILACFATLNTKEFPPEHKP